MKNEMPSLVLDEKICFIRLPPDTLQNFWQVITVKACIIIIIIISFFPKKRGILKNEMLEHALQVSRFWKFPKSGGRNTISRAQS
jgi:hypothetical protein